MTIQEFRQKSKDGGFDTSELSDAEMLLEPKSFQACGKVEGWYGEPCTSCGGKIVLGMGLGKVAFPYQCEECKNYILADQWLGSWMWRMHKMIDALCEGKSIKQYIKTL